MKGPYPKGKGKGKVHPSPSPATNSGDVSSALKLLPQEILALTAALGEKDKEVLAYLITRSMKCHVAPRAAASHRPTIGCGCFECYKSFWSRWNSSSDKGIIDQATDAFEEHLARVEKEKNEKSEKKKSKKVEVEEKVVEESGEVEEKVNEEVVVSDESKELEMVQEEEPEKVLEEEGGEDKVEGGGAMSGGGEKKKSWVDLMGIFNFRFFGA
ncbi:F3I6.21 protein [Rhynchospora pubera]|uniref:F3I6.21 protein n=1 Tax=Rhynchospora pubera TaxID=906938 RepID=A0AAV8HV06_9POAL|nr:F3I6.21 protein [Rhynchospora pubera]